MSTILIVEDDNFFANRLTELLSDYGVETQTVASTQDALTASAAKAYDAHLIDVMLPNDPATSGISDGEARGGFLSGVALARRLRQQTPNVPIWLFSSVAGQSEAEQWARQNNVGFLPKSDGPRALVENLQSAGLLGPRPRPRAFIVHGHDETALLQLKDYIQNVLKWQEPIVLREQASGGKTIIEKFEDATARPNYVFVLLTPDDKVLPKDATDEMKRRSLQNVILELSFFTVSSVANPEKLSC